MLLVSTCWFVNCLLNRVTVSFEYHQNISLDTLDPAKFEKITRRLGWERVMDSISILIVVEADSRIFFGCVFMNDIHCY